VSKIVNFLKLVKNSKASIPPIKGQFHIKGIHDSVEVLWDKWAIPHIFAKNIEDGFFVEGYIHAQYRLFQMELYRRRFSGRLSEIFGEAAIEWDIYCRDLGLHRIANVAAEKLKKEPESELYLQLDAYRQGINLGIEQAKKTPPMEFQTLKYIPEPWRFEDILILICVLDSMESYNIGTEILREKLLNKMDKETAELLFPIFKHIDMNAFIGSNSWVIGGNRMADGLNVLAGDPHLAFSQPILWFMVHLHCPEINFIGVTLPGHPCPIIGHNDSIAWSITNCIADTQDLFSLKINPENEMQYEYEGKWVNFELINEPITVKGEEKPREHIVKISRFGPVIKHFEYGLDFFPINLPKTYALKWTGHDTDPLLSTASFINVAKATNWDDFKINLQHVSVCLHNFMYVDNQGNIGHQVAGQLPLRKKPINGIPLEGTLEKDMWNGVVKFSDLPSIYNPPENAIFNANYKEDKAPNGIQICIDDDKGYRNKRLKQYFSGQEQFSIEDIQKMQYDTKSTHAEEILPIMLNKLNYTPQNQLDSSQIPQVLEILSNWNYFLTIDEVGGTIFKVWYIETMKEFLIPHIGEEIFYQFFQGNPFSFNFIVRGYQNREEDLSQLLINSLTSTLKILTKKLGKNMKKWGWGKLHKTTLIHPFAMAEKAAAIFNIGPYATGGDSNTINNGHHSVRDFSVLAGPSLRQILIPKDWDRSLMCMPGGQYGLQFHKHYKDLMPYWVEGKYFPYLFSRSAIESNLEGKVVFTPK
jgi:penicillin G amidase